MTGTDHYRTLGVSPDASPAVIRKAFRRLAKECHPDVAGAAGRNRFRDLVIAHQVLSDPATRRDYDRQRARHRTQRHATRATTRPLPRGHRGPLRRGKHRPAVVFFGQAHAGQPSDQLRRGNTHVDLTLSPEQATRGGLYPFALSIVRSCRCNQGKGPSLSCEDCGGSGRKTYRTMAGVDVPPRVQAGTILRTQVDSPLMRHPLVLYLTVKVESQGTSPL